MNVALVCVCFPYGDKEPYLESELAGLRAHFGRMVVMPVAPADRARGYRTGGADVVVRPLFSLGVLLAALREVRRNPAAVARTILMLLGARGRPVTKLKNLAVLPKALALCREVRDRGVDHIHAYWLSTPATVAYVISRLTGIPWSASAHRWDIYEENALDLKVASARFVRAISLRGRDDLRSRVPVSAADRISCVPLGIQIPATTVRPHPKRGFLSLLCAAALVPVKGHATLIGALAIARESGVDVRCTLAGDGPLGVALRRAVNAAALGGTVRFDGHIPRAQLHQRMLEGEFDAVVLASTERPGGLMEGIPAALIEAMAFGIPVIATDSGSVPELVDASTGWLVKAGDSYALAAAIVALARNGELAASRSVAARRRVECRHDVRAAARSIAARIDEAQFAHERVPA